MTQWTFLFMPESVHLQSQAWTERQAALAQEAQKILAGWTKNREADLATSLEAMQKLWACRDFGAASTVYAQWWGDAAKRAVDEMNDARRESFRLIESAQKAIAPPAPAEPPASTAG